MNVQDDTRLKKLNIAKQLFIELLEDREKYPADVEKELSADLERCEEQIAIRYQKIKESSDKELKYEILIPNDGDMEGCIPIKLYSETEFQNELGELVEKYTLVLNKAHHTAYCKNAKISKIEIGRAKKTNLKGTRFFMLFELLKNKGRVIQYKRLYEKCWFELDGENSEMPITYKRNLKTTKSDLTAILRSTELYKYIEIKTEREVGYSCECSNLNFCLIDKVEHTAF